jgi:hypothetical protein
LVGVDGSRIAAIRADAVKEYGVVSRKIECCGASRDFGEFTATMFAAEEKPLMLADTELSYSQVPVFADDCVTDDPVVELSLTCRFEWLETIEAYRYRRQRSRNSCCAVDLHWDGGSERRLAQVAALVGLSLLSFWIFQALRAENIRRERDATENMRHPSKFLRARIRTGGSDPGR